VLRVSRRSPTCCWLESALSQQPGSLASAGSHRQRGSAAFGWCEAVRCSPQQLHAGCKSGVVLQLLAASPEAAATARLTAVPVVIACARQFAHGHRRCLSSSVRMLFDLTGSPVTCPPAVGHAAMQRSSPPYERIETAVWHWSPWSSHREATRSASCNVARCVVRWHTCVERRGASASSCQRFRTAVKLHLPRMRRSLLTRGAVMRRCTLNRPPFRASPTQSMPSISAQLQLKTVASDSIRSATEIKVVFTHLKLGHVFPCIHGLGNMERDSDGTRDLCAAIRKWQLRESLAHTIDVRAATRLRC